MAAYERVGAAATARLRGTGPRAFERATGALSSALRREQRTGLQPDDPGAVLPRLAPPDAPQLSQASHHHEPEELASSQARSVAGAGAHQRKLPDRAWRERPNRSCGHAPRAALQRQGLLRPLAGAP